MRNRFLLCIGWVLSGFLMSCTKKDSGSSTLPLLVVTPKIEISSRTQLQEVWRESGASSTETSIGHLVGDDAVEHLPLLLGDRNYHNPQIDYGLWGTVPCFYYYGSYDLADGAGTQDFDQLICKESLFQAGLEYNSLHLTEYKSLTEHCSVEVGDIQDSVAPQDDQTNLYKRRYANCSVAEFDVCTVTETYDQPILGLTDPVDVVVDCHDTGKQLPVDAVVVEDDDVVPTLTKDAIVDNIELASANEKNKILRRGDLSNANIRFFLWSDMYCSYYLGDVEKDGETRSVDHLDCHFEEEYSSVNYHTPLRDHQTADMTCTKKNREFQATDENSQTQFHQVFNCNIDGFELASPDTACVYTKVFNGEDETGQIASTSFECTTADDKKLFNALPPQPISLTKQDISTKDILKNLWREDGALPTETSIGHLVGEDAVEHLPLLLGDRNYHNPQIDYGLWGSLPCFYYYGSYDLADSAGTQDFDQLICKESLFQVGLEYQSVSLEDYKSPAEHCSVGAGDVQDSAVPQADQTVLYKRRYANCSVAEFDVCTVTETYDAPILGLTDPSEVVVDCHDTGKQLPVGAVIEDDDDDDVAPVFTKNAILNNVELASTNEKNKILRRGDLSSANVRFFLWSDMYCSYYLGDVERDGETRSVDHLDCHFEEEHSSVNYHTPLRDHQTADMTCTKKNREFQATDENSQIQFHQIFNCNIDGFELASPDTACTYTKVFDGEDETGQIASTSFECATADDKKLFDILPPQPISITKKDISTKDILKNLWREDGASATETSIGHLVGEDAVEHLPLLLGDRDYNNPQIDYGLWGDLPCFYYYGSYDLADGAGTQDFDHLICKESLFQVGLAYQSISLEDYKSPAEHCSVGAGDVQDSAVPQADQTVLYKRRYANCSVAEFDVCTVTETYDAPILGLTDPSEVVVDCHDTGKQLPVDAVVVEDDDVIPALTKDAIVDNIELASANEKNKILRRGDLSSANVRFFLWSDMYCSYYLGNVERDGETRSADHLDCHFEEEHSGVNYHTPLRDHQTADMACTKKNREFQATDENSQTQFHQIFECNIDGFELASPDTACVYTKVFNGEDETGQIASTSFECATADDKKLFDTLPPQPISLTKQDISTKDILKNLWRESGASGTETSIGHLVGEDAVEHLPLLLGDRNYHNPQIDYGLWGSLPCFYYYGSYDLADGVSTQEFDQLICEESLFQEGLEYQSVSLEDYKSPAEHCSVGAGDVQDSAVPQADQTVLYKRRYANCSIAEFDVCTVTETYDAPILGLTDPSEVVVNCHDTGKQLPVDAVVVEDDDVVPTLTKDAIVDNIELASANEKNKILRRGDLSNANIRFFLWSDMYCSYYLGDVEKDGETRSVDHLDCHFEEEYSSVNYHTPLRDHQTADMTCTKKNREFQATDENSQTQFHQVFNCNIDGFKLASPDTACVYTKVFNGEDETGQIASTSFECTTADDKKLFNALPPQPISLTKQDISTKDILKNLWREDGALPTETSIGHLVGEDAEEHLPLLLGDRNYHNHQIDYGLWGSLPCFYYYGSYDLADGVSTQEFDQLICKESLFQVGLAYQSVSLEDYKSPAEHCSVGVAGDVQDSAVPQADQTVLYKRRYANCSVAEFDVCTVTETYDAPILGLTDPSEVVVNCYDTGKQLPTDVVVEDVVPLLTKDAIVNNVEVASDTEKQRVLYRGDLTNTDVRFFLWSDMYCSYYLGDAERSSEMRSVDHLDCTFEEEYSKVSYHTVLLDHQIADLTCTKKEEEFQVSDANSQKQFHQAFECNIDGFELASPDTACTYTKVFDGTDDEGTLVDSHFECFIADDKKLFGAVEPEDGVRSLIFSDITDLFHSSEALNNNDLYVDTIKTALSGGDIPREQTAIGLWNDYYCHYVSIEGVEELDSDDNSDEDGDGDNTRRSLQSLTCSSENFFTGETFPLLEGLTSLESLCSQRSGFEITHVRDLVRTEVSYQCPLIEGLTCELKLSFDERLDANAEVDATNAVRKKLTCNNYDGQELSYESQDRPYRVSFYQAAQKNQSDTSHAFFYGGKLDSVQLQSLPERIQKAHALVWSEGLNTFFDRGVLVGSYPLPERLTELDFAISLEDILADFTDTNYVELPNLERRKLLRKLQGDLKDRPAPAWWPSDEAYPIDNVHRYFGHWDGFDCHYTEYKTYSGTDTSDREAKDLKDLVCFVP